MAELKIIEENIAEQYSDGDQIEKEIYDYVREAQSPDYSDVLERDHRWPVFYHLSDMREDILNWYDFKPGCSVLEIGAGMGALTGLLCRNAGSVTSVELTLPRARVIQERCKEYDNLTILVGNFNRMEFTEQFDYITLIGVLEYAPGFTESGDPADFLRRIRSLLKPDGKLLVAIENRFGLKYWCGAAEDHTGKPYSGINGYPEDPQVRTFSRSELSDLLGRCGFEKQKFFYPLPDYKFPQVLYSDSFYPGELPGKIRMYRSYKTAELLAEGKLYDAVLPNDALPFMANSFFVECGSEVKEHSPVSAAFFSPERARPKRLTTLISTDKKVVEKRATFPQAEEHLQQILENQRHFSGADLAPYAPTGSGLSMPFLEGETLDGILYRHLSHGELEAAKSWIDRYYELVKASSGNASQADPILDYGFMDMIFQNCMVQGESMTFFDQEWMEQNVPASFLLFRAITMFYGEHPDVQAVIPNETLLSLYRLDSDLQKEYGEREKAFAQSVLQQAANPLSILDDFCESKSAVNRECSLYYDRGAGFTEEAVIRRSIPSSGQIDWEWTLPESCRAIRFDPIEGHYCTVRNLHVISDRPVMSVKNVNGDTWRSVEFFQNTDPQFEILFSEPVSQFRICASLYVYDDPALIDLFGELRNQAMEQQHAYDEINYSVLWKTVKPLHLLAKGVGNLLPFRVAKKGLKSLKNNGWQATWEKAKNKLAEKRFD